MKRTLILLVGFVIVGILFGVIGCNLEVGSIPDTGSTTAPDDESTEPISEAQSTGAAVSVPAISAALLSALNAEYAPDSGGISAQAILFATEVKLELEQNGEHVRDWHLTGTDTIQEDSPPMFTTFLEIDAGESYTLYAEVYNDKVRSDTPVVAGWSEEFEISIGVSTEVGITAIPVEPAVFASAEGGGSATFNFAQTPYSFHDEAWIVLTGMGGEAWLEGVLTPVDDQYVRIIADPAGSADAILLMFDDDGRMSEGGMNDPPPHSWGLFPTDLGGVGGTRAGFMGGPLDEDFTAYIGLALLNRDGNTTNATVDVEMDILERLPAEYTNTSPASEGADPESFAPELLKSGEDITQIVFQDDEGPMVHWFELDGIEWDEVEDPVEITVTTSFDVLDISHLAGFMEIEVYDGNDNNGYDRIEAPALALFAGSTGDDSGQPAVYTALDDPNFDVTILGDGSTQVEFTVLVNPTNPVENGDPEDVDLAALAISSRWAGNQFTVGWSGYGEGELIID